MGGATLPQVEALVNDPHMSGGYDRSLAVLKEKLIADVPHIQLTTAGPQEAQYPLLEPLILIGPLS